MSPSFGTGLAAAALGILVLLVVLWDAFETILLPRRIGRKIRLTRLFYSGTWRIFREFARRIRKPSRRESLLASYGPLSLLWLLVLRRRDVHVSALAYTRAAALPSAAALAAAVVPLLFYR